jgi:hypothetical protein
LNDLKEEVDKTSSAAVIFMNDMRDEAEKSVKLAEHSMTNIGIWANFFKGDITAAIQSLGPHIEAAGVAVGKGAEMGGKHIGDNLPSCTIF